MIKLPNLEKIEIKGEKFYLIPAEDDYVGRNFVREFLGISKVSTYKSMWNYPDFGEALKDNSRPYKREDLIAWLTIPDKKRRRMYKEYINETNKQNGTA